MPLWVTVSRYCPAACCNKARACKHCKRHSPGFCCVWVSDEKLWHAELKQRQSKGGTARGDPASGSVWGADGHSSASRTVPSVPTLKDMGMSPEDLFQWKYQCYLKTDTPEEHTLSSPVPPRVHRRASYQASIRKARAAPRVPLLLFQSGCSEPGASTKPHQTPHVV